MNVSAEIKPRLTSQPQSNAGLRSVTIVWGFTDTVPPLLQASEIAKRQTRGLVLYKDIEITVRRFEVFIADLAMRLSTDNPRIGQYIGYIANQLKDPNSGAQDKIDFINR